MQRKGRWDSLQKEVPHEGLSTGGQSEKITAISQFNWAASKAIFVDYNKCCCSLYVAMAAARRRIDTYCSVKVIMRMFSAFSVTFLVVTAEF